jgi:ABC-2 type transport system permease protein
MTGALIAELMKLVRHRATWGLVWIFPLGVTAVFLLGLAFRYSAATFAHGGFMPPTAASWIASTAAVWKVAGSGPGRFLVGAFTALAFGGEYGWNTWKLIVPHRRRLELIAAKYLVVLGLLLASIGLGAVLSVLFGALGSSLNGAGLPEGIDLGSLLVVQARAALTTLLPILLSMGYASAGAIVLRSTLGGAIVSIAAVVVEGILGAAAPLLNPTLFLALPTYHLRNLASWIETGAPAGQLLSSGLVQLGWPQSLLDIAAWTILLFGLTAIVFERQDLN